MKPPLHGHHGNPVHISKNQLARMALYCRQGVVGDVPVIKSRFRCQAAHRVLESGAGQQADKGPDANLVDKPRSCRFHLRVIRITFLNHCCPFVFQIKGCRITSFPKILCHRIEAAVKSQFCSFQNGKIQSIKNYIETNQMPWTSWQLMASRAMFVTSPMPR